MSDGHVHYLIVGTGLAGDAGAEAIRDVDPAGSIMMVGQEINRPYERRQLAGDYLLGKLEHERLFTHSAPWYARQRINLRTGRTAAHLDTGRQVVALDDGSTISFDALLIATGASPRRLSIPGGELPNVYYLRSIDEADRLRHAVNKSLREGGGQAVVIGATLLAIELAGTLAHLGLRVQLLCDEAHLGGAHLGENAAALVARELGKRNVKVLAGARAARLEGDGRVQRVVLDSGQTLGTDLVVSAVGVVANKQILRTTPIRAENAILVDEHGQTNVPGIYAAGECAAIYDGRFGKHRYLLHEQSALAMGRLAGRNMAGKTESFTTMNYVERRIGDLELFMAGEARFVDHRMVRNSGGEERPALLELGVAADGRLTQIVAVGATGERQILLELLSHRVSLRGQEETVKDPAFDLSALLK